MMKFTAQAVSLDAAAGDSPRTISGIAVPYNVEANVSTGQTVRVLAGALPVDGAAPRLLAEHDMGKIVGMVVAREETPDGMLFTAEIARTRDGDDIVELLKMGAYDSVSIGIEPVDVEQDGRTVVVKSARWRELSIVAEPAFEAARITDIAASAEDAEPDVTETPQPEKEEIMEDNTPEVVEASVHTVPTAPIYAQPRRYEMPSGAEYIAAALEGGHRFYTMLDNIRAAAPDVTTTNNDGVLPTPIVGAIYTNYIGNRPVVDAFGARSMPTSGKTFERPSISTHTSMGVQAAELDTLTAGEFQVAANTVTKSTVGGYVNVSEQVMDFSEPEIIGAMLNDMGRIYANKSDDIAADALVAGATTTANFTDANIGDPTEWVSWMYDVSSVILSASNGNLPTHLFLSPDIWAALGKLEDSQGRPLFPTVGPANSFGQMQPGSVGGTAFGLQVVVDRNFAADTMILGDTIGFECWEQQKGVISVDNPSTLSRTIAWRGYFATLMLDASRYVKAAFI
jgi:uncharacterized protein